MSTPGTPAPHTSPRKRSHDGHLIAVSPRLVPTLPDDPLAAAFSHAARQQSPALSMTSSSLTDLTPSTSQVPYFSNPSAVKSKKRKLTFAEREVKLALEREERDAREKQKAEDKARKDEEKRKKEEEKEVTKRARELEKAEKQKKRDAEKQAKEAKLAQKEEEKIKKERAQPRIGIFFGRPATGSTPPSSPVNVLSGVSSRRSSIDSLNVETTIFETKPSPVVHTEYEKLFPSFFVWENTEVAPINRFLGSRQIASGGLEAVSNFPDMSASTSTPVFAECFEGRRRKRRRILGSVREIVDRLNGTSNAPIDLTEDDPQWQTTQLLQRIPVKYLYYHTDERPPYQGTYTRPVSPRSMAKIAKNPFYRGLPDTDYDYDSEAEWEIGDEPEANEEDEEEEEEEDGDEQEMDDFLDDKEDVGRRRMVIGDMEPVCTGLCWEWVMSPSNKGKLHEYRMDIMDDAMTFPIDPYSTAYWSRLAKISPQKQAILAEGTSTMQPPRLPLSSVNVPNGLNLGFVPASQVDAKLAGAENIAPHAKPKGRGVNSGKPLKMISSGLLPAFKQTVSGSDLTKLGLIEILKKQFPKTSKDIIKDTLSAVATREGAKEADKRWILIS